MGCIAVFVPKKKSLQAGADRTVNVSFRTWVILGFVTCAFLARRSISTFAVLDTDECPNFLTSLRLTSCSYYKLTLFINVVMYPG